MDDIRLIPCPSCGGLPVVLIRPAWPYPVIRVVCSACSCQGPMVYYSPEGDRVFSGQGLYERNLLPGLATARRQAAAAWNEGTCGSGGGASG